MYSRAVSTFWIAHPNNHLISNSAAGSQVWTIIDMTKRIIFTMICNEQWVNVCLQCFHGIIDQLFCDLLWLNLCSLKLCPHLCDIDDENIKAVMQSQIASPHSNPFIKDVFANINLFSLVVLLCFALFVWGFVYQRMSLHPFLLSKCFLWSCALSRPG